MSIALLQAANIPGLNNPADFAAGETWQFLLPLVILTGIASLQLMLNLLLKKLGRPSGLGLKLDGTITLIAAAGAFLVTAYLWSAVGLRGSSVALFPLEGNVGGIDAWVSSTLVVDLFALFATLLILVVLALVTLTLMPAVKRRGLYHAELFPLLMLSAVGMIALCMSRDLLVTFIAIEVVSLPLYVLCGLDENRKVSQESSLKYFLLGAFASGFFIYGAALMYGAAGHLNYAAFSTYLAFPGVPSGLFLTGMALVGTGLFFKLAMVPFHAWLPDVYQGAPTPITSFMAAGVKLGVFAATIRFVAGSFLTEGQGGAMIAAIEPGYWQGGLLLFAALSMIVGNLFAIHQMSAKRLLAYSAIAHTGYLALGLAACGSAEISSVAAQGMLLYLLAYALAAIGCFALISYLAPDEQDDIYLDELHALAGRAPILALGMAILLLSMAGFPLTMGFIGKLLVFTQAWQAGFHGMVIFAVLNSVIGVYYYLRFVLAMYMQPKAPGSTELALRPMGGAYFFVGLFTIVFTLVLGVYPQIVLDLLTKIGFGG